MDGISRPEVALHLAEEALTQGHHVLVIGSSYGPLLRLEERLEGSAYASIQRVRKKLIEEWRQGTRRVLLYTAAACRQDAVQLAGIPCPLTAILLDREKGDGIQAIRSMVSRGTLPLLRLFDLWRGALWIWQPLQSSTLTFQHRRATGHLPLEWEET